LVLFWQVELLKVFPFFKGYHFKFNYLLPIAVTRNLHKYDSKGVAHEISTVIEFTISTFSSAEDSTKSRMQDALGDGKAAFNRMISAPLTLKDPEDLSSTSTDCVEPIVCAWEPLIEKIQLCTQIVDKFSEVCTYNRYYPHNLTFEHGIFLGPSLY
jgi:hypothetical protein